MNVRPLIAAAMMFGSVAAQAALTPPPAIVTNNYGAYTLTYEDNSVFNGPTSNFSDGNGGVGFSWSIPTSVFVSGTNDEFTYALPEFTVTANAGYTLSGPFAGFVGNISFVEVNGATTSASMLGHLSIDHSPYIPFSAALSKTEVSSGAGVSTGYYSVKGSQAFGSFSSLTASGVGLKLSTQGGVFGSVSGQPQNQIQFSFIANPVPEPESYAMMLVGLLAVGTIVRRRQKA